DAIVQAYDEYRDTTTFWSDTRGPPYVIVGNLDRVPAEARDDWRILHQNDLSVVAQRSPDSRCHDDTVPLDRMSIAPRGQTVAVLLDALMRAR
ncbi:MAG: hypothetical protein LC737_05215, partial [Chloroflexi bacterium]|nr:hypothetical protein [Chloroflexota bacterium]